MGQKFAAHDAAGAITGFYDDAISPPPAGAKTIAITAAQYRMLLDGQATGGRIVIDANGAPAVLDPAPASPELIASAKRAERDAALTATDWLVARHQDETLAGGDTTLTSAQLDALLAWRRALRELPDAAGWPLVDLPAAPDFTTASA
ncbi:phage tail assembly chaperone [Paraburkholderia sp. A1RI_3L]|uniref:phage tail assembly chaperone n=1 Tax=Paraburkholderia TaxID=1822464 RepID=UPI003B79E24A